MITGNLKKPYLDNPFQRFHQSIEDYPHFLDDIDDVHMVEYDTYERFKPFKAKEGTTVGDTIAIPLEDNDTKYYPYDIQGESLWTNPPDTNQPTIDHGLDEDLIWAFTMTAYNQSVIKNTYRSNLWDNLRNNHAPFWGKKLIAPCFYKEEKLEKFFRQWNHRLGLEIIKMKHSLMDEKDKVVRRYMKDEIDAYISKCR